MVDFESTIQKMNECTLSEPTSYEKRTYRVDEIQDILGIGRDELGICLLPSYWRNACPNLGLR